MFLPINPKMITYDTNIYLNIEDKVKLTRLANVKQLSLSTLIAIIVKNYYILSNDNIFNEYLDKGTEQTHIKIRINEEQIITPMVVCNAITLYLHPNTKQEFLQELNIKKINKQIQSEFDKTIDHSWLKNAIIRAKYANRKVEQA